MISGHDNSNLPSPGCDLPRPITDAQVFVVSATEATISWKAIAYASNPVTGYAVQYRAIETEVDWTEHPANPIAQAPTGDVVTVPTSNLSSGAIYEFRVRPTLTDDCGEQWDATLPKVTLPPLTPFTDPNFETWLQVFDPAQAASYDDANYGMFFQITPHVSGTVFTPDTTGTGWDETGAAVLITAGVPFTLNTNQTWNIPAPAGSVLQAELNKGATVTGVSRQLSGGLKFARMSVARTYHLTTDVILGAFRGTDQFYHIYSLPGTLPEIDVWRQGVTEASDTLQATLTGVGGGSVRYTHSDGSAVYGFRTVGAPIVVMHVANSENLQSNTAANDQKIIAPPALRLIFSSTRNAAVAARYDGTSPTVSASSVGALGVIPVARDEGLSVAGLPNGGSYYSGDSFVADGGNLPIVGGPGADGNGTAQTLGQDIDTLGTDIRLPVDFTEGGIAYLKTASPFPYSVDEYDIAGALVGTSVANGVGPYEFRFNAPTAGHFFTTTAPAQFVFQTNGLGARDNDEVAL